MYELPPAAGPDDALSISRHQIMIPNGLHLAETTFLDGVDAYNRHVMVLRDGTMRGGGVFLLYRRKLHLFRRQVERRNDEPGAFTYFCYVPMGTKDPYHWIFGDLFG